MLEGSKSGFKGPSGYTSKPLQVQRLIIHKPIFKIFTNRAPLCLRDEFNQILSATFFVIKSLLINRIFKIFYQTMANLGMVNISAGS